MKKIFTISAILMTLSLSFTKCSPSIAAFDQYSYTQTTSIKVDALNVMDMASDDYQTHQKEVQNVNTEISKIYEYEKNRPKNDITVKMWDKIIDTSGHLYYGFIQRWKNENHLSPTFIQYAKHDIDSSFDQIAQLESHKIKKTN